MLLHEKQSRVGAHLNPNTPRAPIKISSNRVPNTAPKVDPFFFAGGGGTSTSTAVTSAELVCDVVGVGTGVGGGRGAAGTTGGGVTPVPGFLTAGKSGKSSKPPSLATCTTRTVNKTHSNRTHMHAHATDTSYTPSKQERIMVRLVSIHRREESMLPGLQSDDECLLGNLGMQVTVRWAPGRKEWR